MAWYPKNTSVAGEQSCPVCDGSGKRKDAKTGIKRKCALCNGTGKIKCKGNAVIKYMSKFDIDRLVGVIKHSEQ